jgi:ABC-2 type transport system permease protein
MNRLTQWLALVRLDLRLFLSDRRALIMLFVVPIGIASFMGSLFGGSPTRPGKSGGGSGSGGRGTMGGGMDLVIVDDDGSAVSRGVVEAFSSDPNFRVQVTNAATARAWVIAGRRPVAVVLPKGFGGDAIPGWLDSKRRPEIQLWHDPARSMETSVVEGMLVPKVIQAVVSHAFTPELGREYIAKGLAQLELRAAGGSNRPVDPVLREALRRLDDYLATLKPGAVLSRGGTNAEPFSLPLPFVAHAVPLTKNEGGQYNGYAHSFAGMGIQFVLMSLLDMAIGLLRDREAGLFRRLRSAPLARSTWMLAKITSFTLISLGSLLGCFAFAMLVFGVRIEGSLPGFLGCLGATALMAATLALTLAALGGTPAGTRGMGIAVLLLLVMIGGAWVPTFVFPRWLQTLSVATPTRWAVEGLDAMTWRGLGLDAAIGPIGALLGFTAVLGAVAWFRFRWDDE